MEYRLSDIAKELGQIPEKDGTVLGYCHDSRAIKPGEIFVAIDGERSKGTSFLDEAQKKGAIAAIVPLSCNAQVSMPLLKVDDPIQALHALAKARVVHAKPYVVGVTGSCGKTTTKEFIATLLTGNKTVFKSPRSENSQVTFPINILNAPFCDIWVLEMGMSEKGELARLVDTCPPDLAVITNIGMSHSEFFEDIDAIAAAKAEILKSKDLKKLILSENAHQFEIFKNAQVKSVVIGRDVFLKKADNGYCLNLYGKETPPFQLPFFAKHFIDNFILSYLACYAIGLSHAEIIEHAPDLKTIEHRFQISEVSGITFIDDAYNASLDSFKAAFKATVQMPQSTKKIAVMGSVGELGKFCRDIHRQIVKESCNYFDEAFVIGPEWESVLEDFTLPYQFCKDFDDLKKRLNKSMNQGDLVLVKGSNSHKLWKIIEDHNK